MRSKLVIYILFSAIWMLGSAWYYVCKIKQSDPEKVVADQKEESSFSFETNEDSPLLGVNFERFKASVMTKLGENNTLKIEGLYGRNEINKTRYENLGYARANAAMALFTDLDKNRIKLDAKEVPVYNGDTKSAALEFYILTKNDFVEETSFGAVLHFDDGDVDFDLNPKIDAYLTYLANEKRDHTIDIIGHTDNVGSERQNVSLGLRRANTIKDLLIGKGLSDNKVNTTSKGSTEPMADNDTDEGKAANRRVEIHIN